MVIGADNGTDKPSHEFPRRNTRINVLFIPGISKIVRWVSSLGEQLWIQYDVSQNLFAIEIVRAWLAWLWCDYIDIFKV